MRDRGASQQQRRRALGGAAASPLFLALVPILISSGLDGGSDPVSLVLVRTAAAAALLWCAIGATSHFQGFRTGWQRDPMLLLGGLSAYAIGPVAGYFALTRIDATAYISIYYLHVPLLALMLPRLRLEEESRRALFGALACGLGASLAVGMFSARPSSADLTGLALAGISALGTLVFAIAAHRVGDSLNPSRVNAEFMTYSTVLIALVACGRGNWGSIDLRTAGYGLLIAGVAWLPGRVLWTHAIRSVGARTSAIFGAFQPAFVALLGFCFLGDRLGYDRWLGIMIVCAGVAVLYVPVHAIRVPGFARKVTLAGSSRTS